MSNLTGLFNPQGLEAPVARNTDEYKVSFKDGKGGIYESVIRFIPYVVDPTKSIMSKQVSWLKNPVTQKGMYVDDPRSLGEYSPIIDMFFKCRNTQNAQIQEFGKNHLSTKQQYAALVQIIQDVQHPDLVGKIKVFKFGKKVWDKLYNEEHPAMGNGVNPFHPIYGRYFYIKCISQSGFNNFDQSYFFDNKNAQNQILPSGFYYEDPTAPGQLQQVTEQSNQQAVADYLAANSPDLSKYDYHPWTAEQKTFVDEVLNIIATYLQGGAQNLQTNLQTLNTPSPAPIGGMQVNTNPVFPGAAPVQPAQPANPGTIMPQMPGTMAPAPQAAPAPQVAPVGGLMPGAAPAPQVPTPTPQVEGLSIGGSGIPGMSQPQAAPQIQGVDVPSVEPANVAFSQGPSAGIGGNLDEVISNL